MFHTKSESDLEEDREEDKEPAQERIILTVYFSGSNQLITNKSNLGAALFAVTREDEQHEKIGFDGCIKEFGIRGGLFGTGLEQQCQRVVKRINTLHQQGKRVRLIVYGYSRGAIAGLLLAMMVGKIDPDLLEVNLILVDPVSGNYLTTAAIDFTHRTLARQTMDVSESINLNKVLVLYANNPLLDIFAHAPVVPRFPSQCHVTEEIVPGFHVDLQEMYSVTNGIVGRGAKANIVLNLVLPFLMELGTTFLLAMPTPLKEELRIGDRKLLRAYNKCFAKKRRHMHLKKGKTRACHSKEGIRIETHWPANYFSPSHKALCERYKSENTTEVKQELNDTENKNEFAYSFSSPCIKKVKKAEPLIQEKESLPSLEDKMAIFTTFLEEIYSSGLSKKSKTTTKGALIKSVMDEFSSQQHKIVNEAMLKDTLRNLLALCLQRDRNACSLFTTTTSGYKALRLLNSKPYSALAEIILYQKNEKVRYRNLRTFVLGRNDKAFFKAKHARAHYQFFSAPEVSEKEGNNTSPLFSNNVPYFFSR